MLVKLHYCTCIIHVYTLSLEQFVHTLFALRPVPSPVEGALHFPLQCLDHMPGDSRRLSTTLTRTHKLTPFVPLPAVTSLIAGSPYFRVITPGMTFDPPEESGGRAWYVLACD